ncbi:unnamed protein product [Enterobius vermicularis]|uniref:BESS domain-containing protein n=1 Tax=Enterobius vermicularis TaxID=51028 RepID=A0A0N4V2H9_ENTVE|nr:unnamed protein product [Enterobius vermicularis]
MLRLNYTYNTGLRITTLNDKHYGHELTPENYAKSCSKIRRSSPKTPSSEKKPVVWRNQQQGSLRESKYEGLNNTSVLSNIQENSSETNLNSSNSAPSYDAPLSSLALNVASQINKTPATNTTNSSVTLTNGHPITPMDLSVGSNGITPDSTEEADCFIQSLHSLLSQKSQLSVNEYNKKVAIVKHCIMQEFPSWNPHDGLDV